MAEITSAKLESDILDDLQRTGYPTEIVAASIMQQRGWGVLHNPSYLDDIEGHSREFDLRAYHAGTEVAPAEPAVGIYLVTECKKSDKPWVFFTTPEIYDRRRQQGRWIKRNGGPRNLFWSDQGDVPPVIDTDDLFAFHHYFRSHRQARTYHEPFKGRSNAEHAQMIYTAVQAATKATLFLMEDYPIKDWLRIYYPLIVFNGDMFEARVTSVTDIDLLRTDHVQLMYHYMEPRAKRPAQSEPKEHAFVVDVIRMEYLEQFLASIEAEQSAITERLRALPSIK